LNTFSTLKVAIRIIAPGPISGPSGQFGDDVIAELTGLELAPGRMGGLRFLRDRATGDWTIDIPPIYRVPATAAEVRAFALACRDCLAEPPGEYDADLFDNGREAGLLGFEIHADGTLYLQLTLNLGGAVSLDCSDSDHSRVEHLVDALLEATAALLS
jgi:hypothetical protein